MQKLLPSLFCFTAELLRETVGNLLFLFCTELLNSPRLGFAPMDTSLTKISDLHTAIPKGQFSGRAILTCQQDLTQLMSPFP